MQLNNLVIISIPHPSQNPLPMLDTHCLSPSKVSNNPSSLRDNISWKKSISAFKKFKGKKDRETKNPKHLQPNLSFLQQQPPNTYLNTKFTLVDNDIKFSLLTNPDYELIKFQYHFDYFDPNTAPFFQLGVTYNFPQHQHNTQQQEEPQETLKLIKKTSTTPRLRKEQSKKDKPKQQNFGQELILKTQNSHSQQNPMPAEGSAGSDPFIIIKAAQFRQKQPSQCQSREQPKRCEEIKKTKSIRKKTKYVSLSEGIYSRDAYSRPRSEELNGPEQEQSDERFMGYGNDELPMIQFDFGIQMGSKQNLCESSFDNLSIYEAKDSSQVRARIRPFIHTTQILQQYEFNPQMIPEKHIVQPNQQMELKNEEALEKA